MATATFTSTLVVEYEPGETPEDALADYAADNNVLTSYELVDAEDQATPSTNIGVVVIPRRVLAAMRAIVDYNWASEESDYINVHLGENQGEPMPGSGHVYETLTYVNDYLNNLED